MKNKKHLFVKFFIVFSFLIFQSLSVHSQSVLNKNFKNYFDKDIFIKFPNWINGFLFTEKKDETKLDEIISFDNTENIEMKFSHLPRIPVSEDLINENSIYKYQQDLQMRFFKSDESLISIYENPLGQKTRVYKEDELIKYKKYDEKERIFVEKIWKDVNKKYELVSEKKYEYKTLEDKFPFKTELLHYEKLINVVEYFNENNFVTKKETYTISKDKEENILQKIFSTESFLYDFENRVTDYIVKKNDFTIKTKYDYSKNLKNPDEIIFENEIKKSEKKYSSDFDYIYTVYLDEKYSIKSEYKNSIKIDESIYLDGNKIRTSSGVKNE